MTLALDPPAAAASTLYSQQTVEAPGSGAEDFYILGPQWGSGRRVEIQLVGAEATPRGTWLATQIESRLNSLVRLPAGWDGFRAEPLAESAIQSAVDIFFAMADEMSFPPQIFPLVDGGLQLEWHAGGDDLEMEVGADGLVHVLASDPSGGVVLDAELSLADPLSIGEARVALRRLSDRIATGLSARA